jgi:hypothetical protein
LKCFCLTWIKSLNIEATIRRAQLYQYAPDIVLFSESVLVRIQWNPDGNEGGSSALAITNHMVRAVQHSSAQSSGLGIGSSPDSPRQLFLLVSHLKDADKCCKNPNFNQVRHTFELCVLLIICYS